MEEFSYSLSRSKLVLILIFNKIKRKSYHSWNSSMTKNSTLRVCKVLLNSTINQFSNSKRLRKKNRKRSRSVRHLLRCFRKTCNNWNQCKCKKRKLLRMNYKNSSRRGSRLWKRYQRRRKSMQNSKWLWGKLSAN